MKLEKKLSLLHIFSIASGVMISAGLFILPGIAYSMTGPSVIVSYFLAGLFATMGMLVQAELASAMPKAGGTYYYVTRSMGPAVGTIYGIITWLALCLKSAFALVGIGTIIGLVANVDVRLIIFPIGAVFVIVNLIGVELAGRIQAFLVLIILSILTFFICVGLPQVNVYRFEPFTFNGINGIFVTAGFVFICYGGLLKVASLAEEVKNPGKTIPLGMIFSLITVSILYVLVITVAVGVLEPETLKRTLTPITDSAGVILDGAGKVILSLVAIIAFITAANSGIMSASRYPFALARDKMIPEVFGKVSNRFKTPYMSVVITGLVVIAAVFLPLKLLVKVASSVLILTYIFTCTSIIILRESRLQNYQPQFRVPLYPWIPLLGLAGYFVFLAGVGVKVLEIDIVLLLVGLFLYWFYGRLEELREYALLHLVERITAKELTSHLLEEELKEVIRERDEIFKDWFDHLVEDAVVMDIEGQMSANELFKEVSKVLAERLNLDENDIYNLLLEREKESSTALTSFLAVPHLIVPGENKFDIVLIRSRAGIYFSESAPKVHSVFVIAGSKDRRNYHLKALAAIAQIVQEENFESNWLNAKNEKVLRDIILLSKRRR